MPSFLCLLRCQLKEEGAVDHYGRWRDLLTSARGTERLVVQLKVTVDLQRPNFANFVFFATDIAKTSI